MRYSSLKKPIQTTQAKCSFLISTKEIPKQVWARDTSRGAPGQVPEREKQGPGENLPVYSYNSQLPTVRGNGITSLMLDTPVRYITQRSKPRPNPE